MAIFWSPSGTLNVAQDPSDLPEQADQGGISSGAMVRCRNLRLDQKGIAKTRDGSRQLHSSVLGSPVWWIEEQGGIRYTFAGTAIYRNEVSLTFGLVEAQWIAIKYNAFNDTNQNVFALNGPNRKRVQGSEVHEWGLEAPENAPFLSVGSATGLTGDYNCKYTYVRKVDGVVVAESNPSPAGTVVTLADQKLNVAVTAPDDEQVTHIRLYRTSAGGEVYNYDQEVEVGTTSFVSTQADGALGDLIETDHDRPPAGTFVIGPAYDGTCFIIKDNRLYYCKPKQPEYWPSDYYIEVSSIQLPGKTAVFYNGQLYYLTVNDIYYIQGSGNGTFFPLPMRAKTGAQSTRGACAVAGRGIYHVGHDGIYLFSSGADTKITEDSLEPIFRGEDAQDMPGIGNLERSMIWTYGNHLYFCYASVGKVYSGNVIVMNLDNNRVNFYEYPFDISAVAHDTRFQRLLAGDSAGIVRQIEARDTDDDGEPIEFEVQGKDFILQTRKHFPRWNKYDVDATDCEECYGELILEGEVFQTHAITGNRETRRRLVREGNGNRATIRIRGSGNVKVYAAESE